MRVPYHIGLDNEYSLSFVGETVSTLQSWLDPSFGGTVISIRAPDEACLFLAYTPSRSGSTTDHPTVSDWGTGTATIAVAYLNAFRGVTSETVVAEHKAFDGENIVGALARVEWRQSVAAVAGQLWSNLVLAHPLPNANHRSATALLSLYLQTQDDRATLATHLVEDESIAKLGDEFFCESKRILTVRRNACAFSILAEHGVGQVERKGDIVIRLADYQPNVQNPYAEFAHTHRLTAEEFVSSYLHAIGLGEVAEATDKGKQSFVQSLSRGTLTD